MRVFPEKLSRRQMLVRGVSVVGAASGVMGAGSVLAQAVAPAAPSKVKVGLMLPYSGTYAKLGETIENGMRMALAEKGGKLAGREVEWVKLNDESDPAKADANARRLVQQDKVDVIVGTVHSGVQMAIQKVVAESKTLCLIPNAGVHAVTRNACLPNVFRTSFTMAQPTVALGQAMVERKARRAVWVTWDYPAGADSLEGFREGYTKAGGTIVKELKVPFPSTNFKAVLQEIEQLKPDAVACFFAGEGGIKFMKDYEAAGLRHRIPLYGSGFLTEGVLSAAGTSSEGIVTTLHYSNVLTTLRNGEFRYTYSRSFKSEPDVYAVQGYDTGLLLRQGLEAVQGDMGKRDQLYGALESAVIDSPRGKWRMGKAHNPVQDIYLRAVSNGENRVIGVAAKALEDSGSGCRLA
ncbi:MAG: ABC transporter substrate-binding protein [Pseudomonadota bacterium]|nr:ABC transporter substrate-binding protein [Pseudomonadota bacterium]